MKSHIVRRGESFVLEACGRSIPLYGYMTYLPGRGRYRTFADAGVPLVFVPVYLGDRGINQESGIRPFLRGIWIGEDRYDFTPAEEAFRLASAGDALLIPRIMTEPPSFWDEAHPEELCRSIDGTPAHASFSSAVRMQDVVKALEAFYAWCRESGWSERIVGWHLAGGNTEEFIRPLPSPGFRGDYSPPALRAWHEFSGTDRDPPSPEKRQIFPTDPEVRRYNEFLSVSTVDMIIGLCREGRRITVGTIPMGAFYGYLVNVTDPERGHAAVSRILASDAVDFLASPFSYPNARSLGQDWPIPGPAASARLHGKPWFMEADVRTCLTEPLKNAAPDSAPTDNHRYEGGVWAGPETEAKSLSAMTKALGSILCSGCAAWWFDMWGGWYDSPAFMDFHRRARELFAGARYVSRADTAVLLNEELIYARPSPGFTAAAHEGLLESLARTGAAFDVYDRRDMDRIDFGRYRAVIFPGECGPLPEAGDCIRIGTGSGSPDKGSGMNELRLSDPAPDWPILRDALSEAGVHFYGRGGDVVTAGGDFLCVHAVTAGEKELLLPRNGTLTDAFSGEELLRDGRRAVLSMDAEDTRLLEVRYSSEEADE